MADDSAKTPDHPRSERRTLEIQTAAHGRVTFDLALTMRRELLVNRRAPRKSQSPAELTSLVATACIARIGDRSFTDDEGVRSLERLQLQLSDEEQVRFASEFLAHNDYLLCRVESDEDSAAGASTRRLRHVRRAEVAWSDHPVERLHQAWTIHQREMSKSLERLNAPFEALSRLKIAAKWEHQMGGLAHLSGLDRIARNASIAADPLGLARGLSRAIVDMQHRIDLGAGVSKLSQTFDSSVTSKLHPSSISLSSGLATMEDLLGTSASKTRDGITSTLLRHDQDRWARLHALDDISPLFASARLTADTGFASILTKLQRRSALDTRLYEAVVGTSSRAITSYFEQTALLVRDAQPRVRSAIDVALQLGSAHVEATSEVTARLIDQQIRTDGDELTDDHASADLDLLQRQRDELIAEATAAPLASVEEIAAAAPLVKVAPLISGLLTLVVDCNEAARLYGHGDIFAQRNRTLRAAAQLPLLLPCDLESLATAVSHLYFLIYEGAGSDNLRFETGKSACGVFLRDDEIFQAVMDLKFLRSKWLAHDPERGGKGADKTYSDLKDTFANLGVSRFPRSPDEYQRLYIQLVRKLHAFLSELRSRLDSTLPTIS